ncbi:MAG: PH domain-containing protein [Phycisphaerae bacterium]
MTLTAKPPRRTRRDWVAQAEGPSGHAVGFAAENMVPSHLLDGGEVVHFAIKPSAWFIPLESAWWLGAAALIAALSRTNVVSPPYHGYLVQLAVLLAGLKLGWTTLEWVSRLYVLTNRRVMSIRGVFRVEMFECALDRIQNTFLTLSPGERVCRVGTVTVQTAAAPTGTGSWRMVSRPLEVHEQLREAITRARNFGGREV